MITLTRGVPRIGSRYQARVFKLRKLIHGAQARTKSAPRTMIGVARYIDRLNGTPVRDEVNARWRTRFIIAHATAAAHAASGVRPARSATMGRRTKAAPTA